MKEKAKYIHLFEELKRRILQGEYQNGQRRQRRIQTEKQDRPQRVDCQLCRIQRKRMFPVWIF